MRARKKCASMNGSTLNSRQSYGTRWTCDPILSRRMSTRKSMIRGDAVDTDTLRKNGYVDKGNGRSNGPEVKHKTWVNSDHLLANILVDRCRSWTHYFMQEWRMT